MKTLLAITLLVSMFCLTACTPSAVAMIDAIVSAAAIDIQLIPAVSQADTAAIAIYADAVLKIAGDLTSVTPATIAKAVADFQALAAPQLSKDAPPAASMAVNTIAASVSAFLKAYQDATVTTNVVHGVSSFAEPPKTKHLKLSAADQKRLAELKTRIAAARAKLKAAKEVKTLPEPGEK